MLYKNRLRQDLAGFTLIEIMIVIVILGVLAALIVPNVIGRPDEARVAAARSDIRSVGNALELYRLDNFRYPTTDQGLEALVEEPTTEPLPSNWNPEGYLKRIPTDPWNNAYLYLSPSADAAYEIISLGADGREGGENVDQDISSVNLP
ncbi:MAG TPA: type II secretion system protein GspG [Porticoccaceae bacterium]|nr:type II secretion system protein GspG [Porticoccaceae bacterium]